MPIVAQYLLLVISFSSIVLLGVLLYRLSRFTASSRVESRIDSLERLLERQERMLREELARNRE